MRSEFQPRTFRFPDLPEQEANALTPAGLASPNWDPHPSTQRILDNKPHFAHVGKRHDPTTIVWWFLGIMIIRMRSFHPMVLQVPPVFYRRVAFVVVMVVGEWGTVMVEAMG